MLVLEDNIGRVQGIGLDEIRRELVIGNFPNIPIYETTRAERHIPTVLKAAPAAPRAPAPPLGTGHDLVLSNWSTERRTPR